MIQAVKTALEDVDLSKYVSDPRDDYRDLRESDRPGYDLVHGVLETLLIVGLGLRFLCHLAGYAIYHEGRHGEPPDFSDEMFRFNNLVKPILEPVHWHQEAVMRGLTAGFGLIFFALAVSTPAVGGMANPAISPTMVYWAQLYLAGHLLLDPVLGVGWRLATADLTRLNPAA